MRPINLGNPVNRSAALNRGLAGWWRVLPGRFGGARFLDLLNRQHATLNNGAAFQSNTSSAAFRHHGHGAILGDGTDDFINFGDPTQLQFGSSDVTLSFWCKPMASHAGVFRFLLSRDDDTTQGFVIGKNSSDVLYAFSRDPDGDSITLTSSFSLTASTPWFHAIVTRNGIDMAMYVNGVSRATGSNASLGSPFKTGVNWNGLARTTGNYYGAHLDDVRMSSGGINDAMAMQLYLASLTGYQNELNWLPDAGVDLVSAAEYRVYKKRISGGSWLHI